MSPVTLVFDDSLQDKVNFLLFESVHHPLILSLPWMLKLNPHINWFTGSVCGKSVVNTAFWTDNGQVGRDQQKLQAIIDWPTPSLWGNVQHPWSDISWDIVAD